MSVSELYKELGKLTREKDRWEKSIPYVSSLLDHGSVKIQAKALWLLGETGLEYPGAVKDAVPAIVSFLDSAEPLLRERAVNALGRIGRGDFDTVRPYWTDLFRFASDAQPKVRLSFIWASENIAVNMPGIYKDHMPVFAGLLGDPDDRVRMEAPEIFRVLGKRRPEFVRPYIGQLRRISETDEDRVVRIHCLGAIKAAGSGQADPDQETREEKTGSLPVFAGKIDREVFMRILVTGFDPFGGEKINPAIESVKRLPDRIAGAEIVKLEVPTVCGKSIQVIRDKIIETDPDVILSVGQAGGRSEMCVERVGINVTDCRIPDNEGNTPVDEPVFADGPDAYFSNLPVKAMVQKIREAGIPASVSNSAGTFICNHVLYGIRYVCEHEFPGKKSGFIHIPFMPEQTVDKRNMPSMNLDDIVKGLTAALEAVIGTEEDVKIPEGTEH